MSKPTAQDTFNRLKLTPLDLDTLNYGSFEVDGIDHWDMPDYADAFICHAEFENGAHLSESQLCELNENSDIICDALEYHLY